MYKVNFFRILLSHNNVFHLLLLKDISRTKASMVYIILSNVSPTGRQIGLYQGAYESAPEAVFMKTLHVGPEMPGVPLVGRCGVFPIFYPFTKVKFGTPNSVQHNELYHPLNNESV